MKRVVIVSDENQIPLLKPYFVDSKIIATNPTIERRLQNFNLPLEPIVTYIKLKRDTEIVEEGTKFIQNWINKNKTFDEYLTYKGLHFFDLMQRDLTVPSVYLYPISYIINLIDMLNSIISKEKPDEIIAVDDSNLITEILKKISNPTLIKYKSYPDYKNTMVIPISANFITKKRIFIGRIRSLFSRNRNLNGKILTLAAGSNYILPILPLIKEIKKEFLVIKPLQLKDEKISKLLKKENISFTPIENLIDRDLAKKIKINTRIVSKNLKLLFRNKEFTSSFVYKGVFFFDILKKTLDHIYFRRGRILDLIANIELNEKILIYSRPKLVLVVEEKNLPSRILVKLAKSQNILTILVQHGYFSESNAKDHFLCDKYFAWGKLFKQYLKKYSNYKEKDIFITGKLSKSKEYNRKSTLTKQNIPQNKKIITLATNKIDDMENKELILETLKAVKSMEDVQLIIKLHPMEDGILQRKLAKLTKTNPIFIQNEINLDEVLNASDLVITYYSTVGLNALKYKKPLIAVNFTGKKDELDYVKSKVALGVYNPKDLKKSIELLLYTKEKQKLLKNAKSYVKNRVDSEGKESLQKTLKIINRFLEVF